MAYVKIEPSGCCIYKGRIQVRLSFCLEPTDPRHSEHHVYVVDEMSPLFKSGYKGKLGAMGAPVNQADHDAWIASLPHVWRDNPFHNHLIYVDATTSNAEILRQAQASFQEFFAGWSDGKSMIQVWKSKPRPVFAAKVLSPQQLTTANNKLAQIKAMVI